MSFYLHLKRRRLNSPCFLGRRTKALLFEASVDQEYAVDVDLLHEDYALLSQFLAEEEMEIRLLDGFGFAILFVGIILSFLWTPFAWLLTTPASWLVLAYSKYRAGEALVDRALLEAGVFLKMHEAGLVWRLMPGGSYEPVTGWPQPHSPLRIDQAA